MATDEEKLRMLLPHWIEHNAEHAAEFRQWAEKARQAAREDVAEDVDLAATELDWVNEALTSALHKLNNVA